MCNGSFIHLLSTFVLILENNQSNPNSLRKFLTFRNEVLSVVKSLHNYHVLLLDG
jgi:hypothetical protein